MVVGEIMHVCQDSLTNMIRGTILSLSDAVGGSQISLFVHVEILRLNVESENSAGEVHITTR